jgi:hypothetical protein
MNEYIKFISAALLNVVLVIGVYFLDKKTQFKKITKFQKFRKNRQKKCTKW